MNKLKIAFFGTPQFAVTVLDELKNASILPSLIVTAPDKPQGRGLILTAPPVKVWAEKNNIKCIQPDKLKSGTNDIAILQNESWDLFIVAAYGKIIPENILKIPKFKTLNVHPSLLPDWRGPSPIESAILNDEAVTGVTIMRLDEEVDHGPIVDQKIIDLSDSSGSKQTWPITAPILEDILAHEGGKLLVETIPNWVNGKIKERQQDHSQATYCQKISKADGLINFTDDRPYYNYLKICAYSGWPGTFFYAENAGKKIRVNIKEATFKFIEKEDGDNAGQLEIIRVIPEGKKEMLYSDFLRGLKN